MEKAQKKRDNKKTKLLNKKKKSEQNGGESKANGNQAETENPSNIVNGEKLQPDLEHEHPENEISSRSRSLSSSSGKHIQRFNRKRGSDEYQS